MSSSVTLEGGKPESNPHASAPLTRFILAGTSSLGVAVSLERGLGFMANLLAARYAGAQVFGAYSLALTTANNIASYAGAGIGTTANRFSGEYQKDTPEYYKVQRALILVSIQSAAIAMIALWFSAGPLASHLLANPGLAHLLRLSAFSSAGIILLECARGSLIGQRKFTSLLGLSALFGIGLILVIPAAASHGASTMIVAQACVAGVTVAACGAGACRLGLVTPGTAKRASGPGSGQVWRFGLVQLTAVIGLNAAGWWTASLVTRGDSSMVQMGFYAVATQLRNLIATVPGLVTQASYAHLTEERGNQYGGTGRVLLTSTLVAMLLSIALAGFASATLPWTIGRTFGHGFQRAELAISLAICTALVHMTAAPAASRLTILSLRSTAVINGIWTALVIGLATWLIRSAGAVEATSILLAAHAVSAVLVIITLKRLTGLPDGLLGMLAISFTAATAFAALTIARSHLPGQRVSLSIGIVLVTLAALWSAIHLGRRLAIFSDGFLPARIREILPVLIARSRSRRRHAINALNEGD